MKSILIVDDEIISRFNTRNIIEWQDYGYEIVAEAANGEEALTIMAEVAIDLVITDIKMPVMSGIELIQKAKAEGINTHYIVLSSFDEYEFVREALVLGAIDYILKLDLTPELMVALLNKANVAVEMNGHQNDETLDSNRKRENTVESRRENLRQHLYGSNDVEPVFSGIEETQDQHYFVVISFDISGEFAVDKKDGVLSLVEDILHDYKTAIACMTSITEVSILYRLNEADDRKAKRLRLIKRISAVLKDYYFMEVTMYISKFIMKEEQIAEAYLQVCQARALRNIVQSSRVVHYSLVRQAFDQKDYTQLEKYIAELRIWIEKNDWQGISDALDGVRRFFKEASYINVREAKHFLTEITSMVDWMSQKSLDKALTDSMVGNYHRIEDVYSREDLIAYIEWVIAEVEDMIHKTKGSYLVRKVKRHLLDHYSEKVQIGHLAEQLQVSNSYLSVLFKRETGRTVKDYLLQIRMDEAENLLKNSQKQIQEIAWAVGCENEHYFSTLFKQRVGVSPSEYRYSNSGS